MKRFFSSVIVIILAGIFARQAGGQDSLSVKSELKQRRLADSVRASELLNEAFVWFRKGNNDSSKASVEKSLNLAVSAGFRLIEARDYELLGSLYNRLANWDEMLFYYLRANSVYDKMGDRLSESGILKIVAGKYFEKEIYDKAAQYSEQQFSFLPKDHEINMADAAESAAKSWFLLPQDSLSAEWYSAALHYFQKDNRSDGMARCLEKLASLYTRASKYNQAAETYNSLLVRYRSLNDTSGQASVYNNLGYNLFRQGNFVEALVDFKKSESLSGTPGETTLLINICTNIAICFQNLGKKNESLEYFNKALMLAGRSGNTGDKAAIEHYLAIIYFKQKDFYHADLYCQDCVESARKSSATEVLQDCYRTWSSVMEGGNDFVKALAYYERYLSIRDSLAFENRVREKNRKDRYDYYDAVEQRIKLDVADQEIQELALKNLNAESERRDKELKLLLKQKELDRSEKERLSQTIVLEREHSRLVVREQEVRSLEQQKINDSLLLKVKADSSLVLIQSNKLLETEKNRQEILADKQKQYKKMALGIGILLFLVAISILGGLLSSRKKNIKLEESKKEVERVNNDLALSNAEIIERNDKISQQKDIIEQKNQAITDSIQYASRIQNAVLPPPDFITEMGVDNFILYKPKDIISGDFYWGMKKEGKTYIAAADCTGHGVPGALMSMLGHVFLDEVLHTSSPSSAAQVLDFLRDEVINTLKQKGITGEARDGMDIAFIIIDSENSRIDYAGANNPLYLIRDNNLTKYNGDRMPIGIHVTTIVPFTNHSIETRKGDLLYIFSDGYADQFGGPRGRKFMYKHFQDLLLRNHYKPMDLQKEILDNTFIKWMGDRSQVDDVLVIGLHL
ncbi:MAG TPA: SpoIIE family protein phosphatase [Bacteroidales bacterium]|nr:SpoIIE family protein phosphatase [Bacteroidales bacterium]